MEDTNWLDTLKVGDKVACDFGRYNAVDWHIGTIVKITATRKFMVKFGAVERKFNKHGDYHADVWNSLSLSMLTPEIEEWLERRRRIEHIRIELQEGTIAKYRIETLRKITAMIIEEHNYIFGKKENDR